MSTTPAAPQAEPAPATNELGWRSWLLAALAVNALLLLVRAALRCWASDLSALAATVTDDSYYYLLPAFNYHRCGFWSFDGEHPTFGVQPVYAWFLTALAAPFDDRFAFFRAALWTSYALFVATGLGIAAFLHRLLRPCGALRAGFAAVLGAHGFLLNMTLVHGFTTLKENALYAPLLLVSLWAAHRSSQARGRGSLLWFGFVTGLAVSCRLTPSTLAIAATTALFAAGGLRRGRVLLIASGAAAAVLPWAIHAFVTYGRVLPTSGSLKTIQSVAALRHGALGERLPDLLGEIGPYLCDVYAYSLGLPNGFGLPQGKPALSAVTLIFPLLLCGLVLVFVRSHALRSCPGALLVPASIAAATLGTALNPILLGVERLEEVRHYYSWYIADLPVLLAILAPLAACFAPAADRTSAIERNPRATAWLAGSLAFALVLSGVLALRQVRALREFQPLEDSWNTQMVAVARRANEVLEANARVGAFNAGLIGFLAEAKVVNLDGLANDDVIEARSRGMTMLEYLRTNAIGYLVDPLRIQGWFGNPFDRVQIVAAVPFRLDVEPDEREYYDGYFILRLVDERFPSFEPAFEGHGVRVVPWAPEDPLGGDGEASRCFRFEPSDGPAAAVFHTQRTFSEMRFRSGAEHPGTLQGLVQLTISDDGGRVLHAIAPGSPESGAIPCSDAEWVRVEVTTSDPRAAACVWLTDVSFAWENQPAPSDEEPFQAYGDGCDTRAADGSAPPELRAEGDAVLGGELRFLCTSAPPGATGTLAIGSAPARKSLEGGCSGLVERTSSTILLQLTADESGAAERRVTIPADVPAGFAYAQVLFRDPDDTRRFSATTNGLRVLLRK